MGDPPSCGARFVYYLGCVLDCLFVSNLGLALTLTFVYGLLALLHTFDLFTVPIYDWYILTVSGLTMFTISTVCWLVAAMRLYGRPDRFIDDKLKTLMGNKAKGTVNLVQDDADSASVVKVEASDAIKQVRNRVKSKAFFYLAVNLFLWCYALLLTMFMWFVYVYATGVTADATIPPTSYQAMLNSGFNSAQQVANPWIFGELRIGLAFAQFLLPVSLFLGASALVHHCWITEKRIPAVVDDSIDAYAPMARHFRL